MTTSASLPKTFNNPVGFERGLWRRKRGSFADVPITSVFGRTAEIQAARLA